MVTNVNDSGVGSLRQAILDSNGLAGADTINFNVGGGGGAQTILLTSALPTISQALQIHGETQPGWTGSPLIEIRGDGLTTGNPISNKTGFTIGASSVVIQQLAINRFANEGIWINSGNATIFENYIGTDITGTLDLGNSGNGVFAFPGANGNRIEYNLISGNNATGILLESNSNFVRGNKIGTDITGTVDLGNSLSGVWMYGGSLNFIGVDGDGIGDSTEGNLISGNDAFGVYFQGNSNLNVVAGNLIGTNAAGTSAIGNTGGGINFFNDFLGVNNRIGTNSNGTSDALERNIVSGNLNYGIVDFGVGTTIAGNYVGTKADGLSALANAQGGVSLASTGATVGGTATAARNVISGNAGFGVAISLASGTGNTVLGNYIGVDANGTAAVANTSNGVQIAIGANANTIGGVTAAARNIISGNTNAGVQIDGSGTTGNAIAGNYIGLSSTGLAMANGDGVVVRGGATSNQIGGTAAAGNVVSGNTNIGVSIYGTGTNSNQVLGNLIGTDPTGAAARPNSLGVALFSGASNNMIGGTAANARNVISGNSAEGVRTSNASTTGNLIQGNYIGLNATGTAPLANPTGVNVGGTSTTVGGTAAGAGNVISGNTDIGMAFGADIGTIVQGNLIGTNPAGTAGLGSQNFGLFMITSSANALIGGTAAGAGNVISNNNVGITVRNVGGAPTGLLIQGNRIGTSSNGNIGIGNGVGLEVITSASGIGTPTLTVGGTAAGAGNQISGNFQQGVRLAGSAETNNILIQGNQIGTNATGTAAVPNSIGVQIDSGATGNTIGGGAAGAGNVISGNTNQGVAITADSNKVQGNIIGLNAAGTGKVANSRGVDVSANSVLIGTDGNNINDANERNVISGNTNYGVIMIGGGNNRIAGNYIGTKADGTGGAVGNTGDGVFLQSTTGNIIGTDGSNDAFNANERNIISGNTGRGVVIQDSNVVAGNWIGVDINGAAAGNNYGVQVTGVGSRVGTNADGFGDDEERNVIGSSTFAGIIVRNVGTTGAIIAGNYIGTDPTGTLARPNLGGIEVILGASNNTIGGTTAAARNIISGNTANGVSISGSGTTGNTVSGNYIGTNATGTTALANTAIGVYVIDALSTTIGGATSAAGNLISGNTTGGIYFDNANGTSSISNNTIGINAAGTAAIANLGSGGVRLTNTTLSATVSQNLISGNNVGVYIDGGAALNVIKGNLIGTDVTGSIDLGNTTHGVQILNSASLNTVGGTNLADRNIISGNNGDGILIDTTSPNGNTVLGNFIGTDIAGASALANSVFGVLIRSKNNSIGGNVAGAGNLISGNVGGGVGISSSAATGNTVQGNYIGTNAAGTGDLGNIQSGVAIGSGASNNTIGGFTAGSRNIISGNDTEGVAVTGLGTNGNRIAGNYIGLDSTGNTRLANGIFGVRLESNSTGTIVGGDDDDDGTADGIVNARNVIVGGTITGGTIWIRGASDLNVVQGNYLGTIASGNASAGGRGYFTIQLAGANNTIGGLTAGAGNLISGGLGDGISFFDQTDGLVQGNIIGLAANGTDLGNAQRGIAVGGTSTSITIGGSAAGARNVISGNDTSGIAINGASVNSIIVKGNYIGTNISGTAAIPNAVGIQINTATTNNTIGGTTAAERNLISGNTGAGIDLFGVGTSSNTVSGNYIGTNASGTAAIGNSIGVQISGGTSSNIIGGLTATPGTGAGNVISGNTLRGTSLTTTAGANNVIQGNILGLDASGITDISGGDGILINAGSNTLVGGTNPQARNVISGHVTGINLSTSGTNFGIRIQGNTIGTDITGTLARGNSTGVSVGNAPGTTVGGSIAGAGNLISGNSTGVSITLNSGSVVAGNFIGTNATGTSALANGTGVSINSGASGNTIGGTGAGARNIISGNTGDGVFISGIGSTGNTVIGNYIGIDASGTAPIGNNVGVDIRFGATGNRVGGSTAGERNVISGNASGVSIVDSGTTANRVSGNYIGTDWTGTSAVGNGFFGVLLYAGASTNIVGTNGDGTNDSTEGNLISSNSTGVFVQNNANNNVIAGNFIGTNFDGTVALGNTSQGIRIFDVTVTGTRIGTNSDGVSDTFERNIVSANTSVGIYDTGGVGTVVAGNYIGTNASGSARLGNQQNGVVLLGASNARIGTNADGANDAAERNIISGSIGLGVELSGAGATNITVAGNYIGTNASGTAAIANTTGVLIEGGASLNTIGGSISSARNVISGNVADGISIESAGTTNNTIAGNYIGVDVSGNTKLANGGAGVIISATGVTSNTVGGLTGTVGNPAPGTGAGNVISGNALFQVRLLSSGQTVHGNMLGLGADGNTVIDGTQAGINAVDSVNDSLIGGTDVRARNVISGLSTGIQLGNGSGTQILNNYVGTDVSGTLNRADGANYFYGSTNLTWGAAGAGNVWVTTTYGVQGSGSNWTIQGNRFGTSADGNTSFPSPFFLLISSLTNLTVGGTAVGQGNQFGDQLALHNVTGGTLQGNTFGLNAAGNAVLAGSNAELSLYRSSGLTIGGATDTARNVFAGSSDAGVAIQGFGADNNVVRGNYFGTNRSGTAVLGNSSYGVRVEMSATNTTVDANVISKANSAGILISGQEPYITPDFAAAWFKSEGDFANGTGYQQPGLAVGTVSFGTGIAGQAFQFSRATPGYVKSEHLASYTLDAINVSVESWINPATLPTAGQEYYIGSNGDASNPNYAAFLTNSGGSTRLAFRYRTSTGSQTATSAAVSFGTGSFHHVAVTADGASVKFYVDGAFLSTVAIVGAPQTLNNFVVGDPSVTLYVGGGIGATPRTFDGKIDELAVYNRPLTPAEINRIFTIGGVDKGGNWTRNTTVTGNIIGLLADGITPGAIAGDGIRINSSESNTIGGTTIAARNIIAKTGGSGINLTGKYARYNTIAGNYIGTNAAGTAALGNVGDGVTIGGGAEGNTVGGLTAVPGTGAGNVISGNGNDGITVVLAGANANVVLGNIIGLNAAGTADLGNGQDGVYVNRVIGTVIGGTAAGSRNVISGNQRAGVFLTNGGSAVVRGNFIGADITGTLALGNTAYGVGIFDGSSDNTIGGGSIVGAGNLISGNTGAGVTIQGAGSSGNKVQGNRIGLNVFGSAAVANSSGVLVAGAGINNIIGVDSDGVGDALEGNLISGNFGNGGGIAIFSSGVTIAGNVVGLDATGTLALPNQDTGAGYSGVVVSSGNRIGTNSDGISDELERNVIAGNIGYDLLVAGNNNTVAGNYVGLNRAGTAGIGLSSGLTLWSNNNLVGTNADGVRDDLERNVVAAVRFNLNAANNTIAGNFIGTTSNGLTRLASAGGIELSAGGGSGNLIGGPTAASRNIVASQTYGIDIRSSLNTVQNNFINVTPDGNSIIANSSAYSGVEVVTANNLLVGNNVAGFASGIRFLGAAATSNTASGNYIGTNSSGTSSLGNTYGVSISSGASNNTIGGSSAAARNVISGNIASAVIISDATTTGNVLLGNYIGLGSDGSTPLGNEGFSVFVNGAPNNTIGGLAPGEGNVISATTNLVVSTGSGIQLYPGANNTRILGNRIGTDATGNLARPNRYGIVIPAGVSATEIRGNQISSNTVGGIDTQSPNSVIAGNFLGTNANGTNALGSGQYGVVVNATNVRIGGIVAADRNIISGHNEVGIGIQYTATGVLVQGNYIGLDVTGNAAIANGSGVVIAAGPQGNTIGGTTAAERNVISGNLGAGVRITGLGTNANSILGNYIGSSATGNFALANAIGIQIDDAASNNTILDNQVRYSTGDNILIEAVGNLLHRNVSTDMGGLPIRLIPSSLSPGTVTIAQVVSGTNALVVGEVQARPTTTYTIELFSSPTAGQASRYVASGSVTTDALGFATFSISPPAGQLNGYVHATLTGLGTSGSTSTSALSSGVLGTPAIILGLRSQSPEGTPITLSAFASTNPVTGYLWEVKKDGLPYAFELRTDGTQSDGGIQFTPDDEGFYTVSLRVTLADGTQTLLGPFDINVYNVAPTPSFSYSPSVIVAGTAVTLSSNNSDPGQLDILKNSWEIRAGSPTGPVVFSAPLSVATTTSFTPPAGGFYYTTMTVDDGDGGVRSLTREITVNGLPGSVAIIVPDTSVLEGQTVRARAPEAELNRTEQLTFNWTVTKTPTTGPTTNYPFTTPSRGVVEFVPDDDGVYTIGLAVSDGVGSVNAGTQQVVVGNVAPRVQISGGSNILTPGVGVNLSSIITDAGSADTHTVSWIVTRDRLPFGTPGTGNSYAFAPNSAGTYIVTATATDDNGGVGTTRRAFTLSANGIAVVIAPPSGPYVENNTYNFTANPSAAVTNYSWRARSAIGVQVAASNSPVFAFTPQQGGEYLIELSVTFVDGRIGNAVFTPMSVQGIAPTIASMAVIDPPVSPIYEGTSVTVRALAIDTRETVGLNYRWELKKPGESVFTTFNGVDGSPTDLRFLPTDDGAYQVRVSITDSQNLTVQQSLTVSVLNADPLLRLESTFDTSMPTQVAFAAIAIDPGVADTPDLRFEWSVNGGAFSVSSVSNLYSTSLTGLASLRVRATDGDGGVSLRSFFVIQGTAADDTFTITAANTAMADPNDQILYLALDGNDNITIASSVTKKVVVIGGKGNDNINASATFVSVILDGGEGDDTLAGGVADDVLLAGIGTNILNGGSGNNRFVGGGNDTMIDGVGNSLFEVHFSTIVLQDAGGFDTIDLTSAQSGVKLNLSSNTGTPQPVFSGSTLALTGSFEKLIGSNYGDELQTDTSGTEIDGGLGDDKLLASNATGAKLSGGDGNDMIVLSNSTGTFDGGAGNDTVLGSLQSSATTNIATGVGNDVVNVSGFSTTTLSNVSISLGDGVNTIIATRISGKIYGSNGASGVLDVFGSASATGNGLDATISSSTNVDIFGSASTGVSTIAVTGSSDIDIFGSASPTGGNLDATISSSTNVDIFGSARGQDVIVVTGGGDIGIFGSASPTGGNLAATITGSTNVDIFGSARGQDVIVVTGGGDIGIFGSASPTGGNLDATISSSTNVDIFGSARGQDVIVVSGGGDIDIYGLVSGLARLSGVQTAVVSTGVFGTATIGGVTVEVSNSQNVDIFGSASSTGPSLNATISSSTNVDIFGSASPGSIIVISSQDVDIFGSASTGTVITITSSGDIDIFGGYGDNVTLKNASRTRVEGGVFGSASGQGLTVSVTDSSTEVGIFGTSIRDSIYVGESSYVGLDLRGGDDIVIVDGAQHFVAITDDGVDRITIRSGFDMLIYLGAGDDQAELLGGQFIRLIGEAGADEFMIAGGSNFVADGGDGNDRVFVTGGNGINIRGDRNDDQVDVYGASGLSVVGGTGNDRLRVFGSLGSVLGAGQVNALLDGQDDNDGLEVRPLLSVLDRGPVAIASVEFPYLYAPTWMTLPLWITAPTVTTFGSSIALVGGSGNNSIWLEGSQRLYGIGGDDSDIITLQSGGNSEVAGGRGADIITVGAVGTDNRVFGDQDDDTINAYGGTRLGIFGEEGLDTIRFFDGQDGFARGGDSNDVMEILSGNRLVLAGEAGNDLTTILGGVSSVAAGGIGDDRLEIHGGSLGLLLGQSGNDHLMATGGVQSILSGGDGDDRIDASNRGDDLYGDDGDDEYRILPSTLTGQLIRLRELLYVDPADFEPAARGSDTIDLSAFTTGAVINLSTIGLFNSQTVGLQSVIAGQVQLILLGSLENIIGTQGNDTLTGNSESNLLDGRGGNDSLIGLAGDDTLDGGAGNDTLDGGTGDDLYRFTTQLGNSLGLDTVYEATGGGNDGLQFSGLPAGLGTFDLNLTTPQSLSGGLLSVTLRSGPGPAAASEIEEVVGTDFNDTILGNDLDNRFEPRGGNDTVNGQAGSDIYVFSGRSLGSDLILDATSGIGNDTLDFTGFDAPLVIDLGSMASQNLGELTLTLGAGDAIENVIGTSYDDSIYGNIRDNNLFGGAGADYLNGRSGNDRLAADLPVVVMLDFDSAYRADRGDYNYSPSERAAIEQRLNAAYAPFNWLFTQSESTAREKSAEMGRSFVRLAFSQGRGGGVSGDAGEVDFRNINRRLTSEVNINPLLPTVRDLVAEQLGSSYTASQYAQLYSSKVLALTSTIAAHELAHTAGLRHADSFGPIGSGVFQNADLSQMHPDYTGARDATETPSHIMASPASVGTTIKHAALTTYFGERESMKLAFNEIGRIRREANRPAGTADDLGWLPQLYVPNLLPANGAANSGKVFDVSALAVVGDLQYSATPDSTEVDIYKFKGRAGEWVNIELMAAGIRPLRGEAFDGLLKLYRANGTQLGQLLAENDDELEGTKDARLQDVLLTADGDYYVTVSRSPQPALEAKGGRYELLLSRFRALPAGSLLPPVVGDTLVGGAGADTLHGAAADDLILANDAAITDLADELYGHAGTDTLDLLGQSYNYRLPAGHSIENIINAPSFTFGGPTSGAVGQVVTFVLTGNNPQNGTRYVVNWGDGTSTTLAAINGPVSLAHQYLSASPASGFIVTADLVNAANVRLSTGTRAIAITQMATVVEGNVRALYVGGGSGTDSITVRRISATSFGIKLTATGNETIFNYGGGANSVDLIIINGLAGNDTITIDPLLTIPAELDGGEGNDVLRGGGGNDILLGGDGVDQLYGNGGNDLLIGGRGKDKLFSDGDGDILIASWTDHDGNIQALREIKAYWGKNPADSSLSWYQTRLNVLANVGTAGGFKLNATTVHDDAELDVIYGVFNAPAGSIRKRNLYFAKLVGAGINDSILNKTADETATNTPNA